MAHVGSAVPRLSTAPLGPLDATSSRGFAFDAWCTSIGCPLLPWQREAAVRSLETMSDGSYRFKKILILVGRQSGKTHLLKLLALWRMIEDGAQLVVGTAQNLVIAKEAWQGSVQTLLDNRPALIGKVRWTNGEQCLTLAKGPRYMIQATTRGAGRGLTVDLLILDEVREHRDWDAYASLAKTTMIPRNAQIVCISNAGDDLSVVLNSLRRAALTGSDDSVGLFEWSAPDGCALDDPEMWALALPGLGHILDERTVRSMLATDPPNVFRTEMLCQSVAQMQEVCLDQSGWARGADPSFDLGAYRGRFDAALDVSTDGHVVLCVGVLVGAGVRVQPVAAWGDTGGARSELPALLDRLKPRSLGWFPGGPANALAPLLESYRLAVPLTGQTVNQACAGFTDMVALGRVFHDAGALLDGQVATAISKPAGDGFRFSRGSQSCNALYAAAGAAHLALSAPPPKSPAYVL